MKTICVLTIALMLGFTGDAAAKVRACGGIAGLQCSASQWCDYGKARGADRMGVCRPRPQMCPMIYVGVCGVDGKTYPNECLANRHGVSVAHPGKC